MKPAKTFALSLAMLAAIPLTASAQVPTSRPANPPGERGTIMPERRWSDRAERPDRFEGGGGGMGDRGMGDRGMGERGGRRYGQGRMVTDEQWEEIRKFMAEHSPRRTAELDNMSSEPNKELLKRLMTARYDFLMNSRREDTPLFEIQVEKMRAEDAIFGLLQDSKRSSGLTEDEKKTLREHVTKLVESNFKERELRIGKARSSLSEAESRLEEDRKEKDAIVTERMNQYVREGARPLKMERQDREGLNRRPNASQPPPADR